jgi:hypothetical protein
VAKISPFSRSFAMAVIGLLVCVGCGRATFVGNTPDSGNASACGDDSDTPEGSVCLERVLGRVLTETPLPPQAVFASVCSASLCIPATMRPDGSFASEIGRWALPNTFAVHIDGRPQFADAYARLPLSAKGLFAFPDPITLVELPSDGPTLPEDTAHELRTFSSGDVALELPAGARLQFSAADFEAASRKFRAASARSTGPYLAVFAFGPFGASSEQSFTVTLPLPNMFKSGARIEVWTLSDDSKSNTAGTYVRETQWATLSADGKRANITIKKLSYVALKEIR